jgi:hypothetical protein
MLMRSILRRSAPGSLRSLVAPVLLVFAVVASPLHGQATSLFDRGEVWVNSEFERYLRVLQVAGISPLHPWSVRSFSPSELDRLAPADSLHPWDLRFDLADDGKEGLAWGLLAPRAGVAYNSAVPYGSNNGAVWAGRGLTAAVQAGVAARYGPVSLALAPVFFRSENRPFELMANGQNGRRRYADGRFPLLIDLPQRFGEDAYSRIDPGQSTLRVDLRGVALGISTANQHWGPATEHPLILGSNAPGFAHLFLGTSTPADIWIGTVHGRMMWGRLEQSPYSPADESAAVRMAPGLVAVFTPRGLPGLELGVGRFFHTVWSDEGLSSSQLFKPLQGLLKSSLPPTGQGPDDASSSENQLASVFARWVFPHSGLEIFGEYAREDHNWHLRDLALQPDHFSGYTLGFQKVWRRDDAGLFALRAEVLNTQRSHLVQVRHQGVFYRHHNTIQGHTHRGQILGSSAGYGGAGALLRGDYYHDRGRWSLAWSRTLRQDVFGLTRAGQALDRRDLDVIHSVGAESLLFHGRFDITAGVNAVYNLNRNFSDDVFNLNAALGVRIGL